MQCRKHRHHKLTSPLSPPFAERKTPKVVGAGVGDGVMGGSGPRHMDIDGDVDI